jgi:hypothetical protein
MRAIDPRRVSLAPYAAGFAVSWELIGLESGLEVGEVAIAGRALNRTRQHRVRTPQRRRPSALDRQTQRREHNRHLHARRVGARGRHFCLGTALARLELRILVEETLKRYPNMTIDREPTWVVAQFSSQLKSLPVRLDG